MAKRKTEEARIAVAEVAEPKAKVARKPRVRIATQGIVDPPVVDETEGGLIRPKRVAKVEPSNPPHRELEAGQLVQMENGSVWTVLSVRFSGADVACVRGGGSTRVGTASVISRSAAGHRFVTLAELGAMTNDDAENAKCDDCIRVLAGEEGFDFCPIHGKRNRVGSTGKRSKIAASDEDVVRIVAMRAEGMGYVKIETALGWPDSHGNRSWKICRDLRAAGREVR